MNASKSKRVSERDARSVSCPTCARGPGKPCLSSRQPGANTFGGGWGGPPDLDRAHQTRRAAVRERTARRMVAAVTNDESQVTLIELTEPQREWLTRLGKGIRYGEYEMPVGIRELIQAGLARENKSTGFVWPTLVAAMSLGGES